MTDRYSLEGAVENSDLAREWVRDRESSYQPQRYPGLTDSDKDVAVRWDFAQKLGLDQAPEMLTAYEEARAMGHSFEEHLEG